MCKRWEFSFIFLSSHFYFPASGQTVVSVAVTSPSRRVLSVLSRIGFSMLEMILGSSVGNHHSRYITLSSSGVHHTFLSTTDGVRTCLLVRSFDAIRSKLFVYTAAYSFSYTQRLW